jgi:hypothetical protein
MRARRVALEEEFAKAQAARVAAEGLRHAAAHAADLLMDIMHKTLLQRLSPASRTPSHAHPDRRPGTP